MSDTPQPVRHYLVVSDFDQTLSFNDSGVILSELLGVPQFEEKVRGLSRVRLVQQGAELTYLLRHDPEFRCVRREHLVEAGRRVALKKNLREFVEFFNNGLDTHRFTFYVVSAAPREVVEAALDGIVPPTHIIATELDFEPGGEICAIKQVSAGYGKVAAVEALEARLQIAPDHTIFVGDGSSDLHVILRVNNSHGYTIAVSEAPPVVRLARRTVLSDNALSVLVPILEDIVGWDEQQIRAWFEPRGLALQEWEKARTDWLTIRDTREPVPVP